MPGLTDEDKTMQHALDLARRGETVVIHYHAYKESCNGKRHYTADSKNPEKSEPESTQEP